MKIYRTIWLGLVVIPMVLVSWVGLLLVGRDDEYPMTARFFSFQGHEVSLVDRGAFWGEVYSGVGVRERGVWRPLWPTFHENTSPRLFQIGSSRLAVTECAPAPGDESSCVGIHRVTAVYNFQTHQLLTLSKDESDANSKRTRQIIANGGQLSPIQEKKTRRLRPWRWQDRDLKTVLWGHASQTKN